MSEQSEEQMPHETLQVGNKLAQPSASWLSGGFA